jgi:hypothetical protein
MVIRVFQNKHSDRQQRNHNLCWHDCRLFIRFYVGLWGRLKRIRLHFKKIPRPFENCKTVICLHMQRERLVNLSPPERVCGHMTTTIMEMTLSNLHISLVRGEITRTFLPKYSHDTNMFFLEQTPVRFASVYRALRFILLNLIRN